MNWFTHSNIALTSTEEKKRMIEEDGGCEHVEDNPALATNVGREMDSFGIVGQYVCCAECHKKQQEAKDNEQCQCRDCNMLVARKDGITWKWYDFIASQGDEALFICNKCRVLPTHVNRVARDDADYRAERGLPEEDPEEDNMTPEERAAWEREQDDLDAMDSALDMLDDDPLPVQAGY